MSKRPIKATSKASSPKPLVSRTQVNALGGNKVDPGVERGRLVVVRRTYPSYTLDELLAQCGGAGPDVEDRMWLDAKPVGTELL